jgi:hypothetical protein
MHPHSQLNTWNDQKLRIKRVETSTSLWGDVPESDVKTYLRIPTNSSVDLLSTIQRAGTWVEEMTASSLDKYTVTLVVDLEAFQPDFRGKRWINLPFGPVTGVTSIDDSESTYSTLVLDDRATPMRLLIPDGVLTQGEATITYTTGFDEWDDLPHQQRTALLFSISHLWQIREAVSSPALVEIPMSLQQALRNVTQSLPF